MHNYGKKYLGKDQLQSNFHDGIQKCISRKEIFGGIFPRKVHETPFSAIRFKAPPPPFPCAEWKTWKGFRQRRRSHERILRLLKGRKGERRGGDCFPRNFRQESWKLGSWQRMEGREGERGGLAGLGFCGVAVAAAAAKKEKGSLPLPSGNWMWREDPPRFPLSPQRNWQVRNSLFYSKLQECIFTPGRPINYRQNQHLTWWRWKMCNVLTDIIFL